MQSSGVYIHVILVIAFMCFMLMGGENFPKV